MKKYIFFLLLLCAAMPLHAQIMGDISVTRKVLRQQDGMLEMELEIRVGRDAVTRSQSWTIIPELSTSDRQSVKLFPHVLVTGPYQKHMRDRRRKLSGSFWIERQPYAEINSNGKTDQLLTYKMSVPYEAWMASATLVLRQIQRSPGDKMRVYTVDVNGAVETQSK